MRFPVDRTLPLSALILLGFAASLPGGAGARDRAPVVPPPVTGPAADYPVVVGEPFTIAGTVWTPSDQLNYDEVGAALVGEGAGVSGAHKTLPLPCYVEVTALDTGKTILVRIERRGPMVNDALVELSPDAAAQLGLAPGSQAPVRVRRVNPPEEERAMLRAGGQAPMRMETPEGLLKVLRRKLTDHTPLLPPPGAPGTEGHPFPPEAAGTMPGAPVAKPVAPPPAKKAPPAPRPAAPPPPAPAPKPPAAAPMARGSLVVQVGAFSIEANARRLAASLGGEVSRSGKLWRVRMGPFADRAQAARALEKARASGYKDARIQSAD